MKPTFHAGHVEKSVRLKRVLQCLRDHRRFGITTLSLNRLAFTTRSSSDVSELRSNGYRIDCKFVGSTPDGLKVHRYHLKTR
jgi:hypothetical protein